MAGALSAAMRGKTSTRKTSTRAPGAKNRASTPAKRKPSAAANLQRLKNRAALASAKYREGVSQTVHVAEVQGALAISAFAAGYMGPEKMRLWNNHPATDARLVLGGAGTAWGLMQAFNGDNKSMSGNHTLALSTGVLASVVYENSHNMGVDLAIKRSKATLAPAANPRTTHKLSGRPDGDDEGDIAGFGRRTRMGGRLSRR